MINENNSSLDSRIADSVQKIASLFTKEELVQIEVMFKIFAGEDGKINKNVSKVKSGQKCIAYIIDEELCKGSLSEIENPQYSHVVPENQLKKLKIKEQKFYNVSNMMFNVLGDKVIESNISEAIFVGFCSGCEKSFTKNDLINIDSELNLTPKHMFKYLYRYLGKEIVGQTHYIKLLKSINNGKSISPSKGVNKVIFNIFLSKMKNSNLDKEIAIHIKHKIYLKTLFLDYGNIIEDKYKGTRLNLPKLFEFINVNVDFNILGIIGQSLIHYPMVAEEFETKDCIFTNFIFDNQLNKTRCYMLIKKDIFNLINTNNIFSQFNDNQKALFIIALAFEYTKELYFSEVFKNTIVNKINEWLAQIDRNDNVIQKYQFLLNKIQSTTI